MEPPDSSSNPAGAIAPSNPPQAIAPSDSQVDLTDIEISQRLRKTIGSKSESKIVDDAYDLTQKSLASEDAHAAKLDARATSLFGAAGFSMTVAFSYGGWALLDHARDVPFGEAIALLFVAVLGIGLRASYLALQGLRLSSGHMSVNEWDIFRDDLLTAERTSADYRVYITTHLSSVWQSRRKRNDERALIIRNGQTWFLYFLGAVLVLSGLTTASTIARIQEPKQPSATEKVMELLEADLVRWHSVTSQPNVDAEKSDQVKPAPVESPPAPPEPPKVTPPKPDPRPSKGRPRLGNTDKLKALH